MNAMFCFISTSLTASNLLYSLHKRCDQLTRQQQLKNIINAYRLPCTDRRSCQNTSQSTKTHHLIQSGRALHPRSCPGPPATGHSPHKRRGSAYNSLLSWSRPQQLALVARRIRTDMRVLGRTRVRSAAAHAPELEVSRSDAVRRSGTLLAGASGGHDSRA